MEDLFALAKQMELYTHEPEKCENTTMASLFYEKSTRTRDSFKLAMLNLGGKVIGFDSATAAKNDSLPDVARVYSGYVKKGGGGVIVIRHPEAGSAQIVAEYASVPVINAGDGINEHPSQTLVDLYTIQSRRGQIDGLTIGIYGDLKYGRTVHSLMRGLNKFEDINFYIWAPQGLELEDDFAKKLRHTVISHDFLSFSKFDVLYVTRLQEERHEHPINYEQLKHIYFFNAVVMQEFKNDMLLMHPLPREGEIHPDVDKDSRAIYFEQAANGVPVRMALIATLLNRV